MIKSNDRNRSLNITGVEHLFKTPSENLANCLLRCDCKLLDIYEGNFIIGQFKKFTCPKCSNEIEYYKVSIETRDTWEIDCSACGKAKSDIFHSIFIDEYLLDNVTNPVNRSILRFFEKESSEKSSPTETNSQNTNEK